MQRSLLTTAVPLVGGILFILLFAGEKWGINTVLFTGFLLAVLTIDQPLRRWSTEGCITAVASLLLSGLVVLHNTGFAKFCLAGALLLTVGMVHRERVRFLVFGLLLTLRDLGRAPVAWVREVWPKRHDPSALIRLRHAHLLLVPLLLFGCFYGLYAGANAQFARLSASFWSRAAAWVGNLFSGTESLYFLVGLLLTGAALYRSEWPLIIAWKARLHEELVRRRKRKVGLRLHNFVALKNEYRTAILLFASVNVLLFLVNLTDLLYVWTPQAAESAYAMKQYVHEGTYLLIASILLAAGIVLFFFRGNLNFYRQAPLLRKLTYAWIAQNGLLTASVALRNYHYIHEYGLAFKRIGVIVFLLATITGLYWLYRKVRYRRTAYYLWHRNTWSVFFLLVLTATVNWTRLITTYNLSFANERVDWTFLLDELPERNNAQLAAYFEVYRTAYPDAHELEKRIIERGEQYATEQAMYSWLSWNWADAQAVR